MSDELAALVARFEPVGLDALDAQSALRTRVDRKYVVEWETLAAMIERLAGTHRALEIAGGRTFVYESLYFDSPGLATFRDHTQARRRRFKCRVRHYVDSDRYVFEVKLKGRRGATVKRRLAYDAQHFGSITPLAEEFVRAALEEEYGRVWHEPLRPALKVGYRRATLMHLGAGERVTCDVDMRAEHADGRVSAMRPRTVVVESKTPQGRGAADAELRALGVRPVRFSKYCVGLTALEPQLKAGPWRRAARAHFAAASRASP